MANKAIKQSSVFLPGNEKELGSWLWAEYWEVGSKSSQFNDWKVLILLWQEDSLPGRLRCAS